MRGFDTKLRLLSGRKHDGSLELGRDGNQQSLKNFGWSTDARRNHRRDINFECLQSTALQSLLQALGGFGPSQILGCTNVQNGLSGWNGQERWTQSERLVTRPGAFKTCKFETLQNECCIRRALQGIV